MKRMIALFAGCIFLIEFLSAQTDFRPGYVIDAAGDTLWGEVSYRGDLLMGRECKFRQSGLDESLVFLPGDIRAYRFVNSKYFVSREVDSSTVFLEFLINGEVNMYYLRDESGDRYFLDKEGIDLVEIRYTEEVRERDGKYYEYQSKDHIGILQYHLRDAPMLKAQIAEISKPRHKSLIKLGEDYHEAVCEDEVCIIYEKIRPALKLSLEFVGSMAKYRNVPDFDSPYQFRNLYYGQFGLYMHFGAPRINEKLYVRTGLRFFKVNFVDETYRYAAIPFQIEYIYPKGRIRPRISYGVNIWMRSVRLRVGNLSLDLVPALNVGTNIRISERFYLTTTADVEFYSSGLVFLSKRVLSVSGNVGVFVKL